MIAPTSADIGRSVIYRDHPDVAREEGVVTSFDGFFVFVWYGTNPHSTATKASHLEWAAVKALSQP